MSNSAETVRAWVDIDLMALLANAKTVAAVSQTRLLPMVKANGYGLGAVRVARTLEAVDPWGYGVATTAEGSELRGAGIDRPILVFTPLQADTLEDHLVWDLRPVVGDLTVLRAWLGRTERPFHLEVDTGMARSGVRWEEVARERAWRDTLVAAPGFEGAFTQFHSAGSDPESVRSQWSRLQSALASLGHRPALVHAANSAAALQGTQYAGDLVRPGIFLYGGAAGEPTPRAVARLQTRVVGVRAIAPGESVGYGATWVAEGRTVVATLGIGYADGVPRSLGNRGLVEINGALAPILGRISMDLTTVGPQAAVAVGDVATIYGGMVSLDAQAELAGTISYELLTALGGRVIRRYRTPE